jgi:DNA repair photolyase
MGLNKSKGNMYEFITHTWNTIKGACEHDCSYCYMKRWGKLNPVRFDEKELKTDLGKDNFIFIGSSCDMWSNNIPDEWIQRTLDHCEDFGSKYLFQTKNPSRILDFINNPVIFNNSVVCTTIESNKFYKEYMRNSPDLWLRASEMNELSHAGIKTFVTIEPIMDFDLDEMLRYIETCLPDQVNIGADTGKNRLPEPSKEKLLKLIDGIQEFTTIHSKSNLKRLLK